MRAGACVPSRGQVGSCAAGAGGKPRGLLACRGGGGDGKEGEGGGDGRATAGVARVLAGLRLLKSSSLGAGGRAGGGRGWARVVVLCMAWSMLGACRSLPGQGGHVCVCAGMQGGMQGAHALGMGGAGVLCSRSTSTAAIGSSPPWPTCAGVLSSESMSTAGAGASGRRRRARRCMSGSSASRRTHPSPLVHVGVYSIPNAVCVPVVLVIRAASERACRQVGACG